MAYDANDPADKKIVDALVKAAVQAAGRDDGALLPANGDAGEIERLENELEAGKSELRKVQGELRQVKRDLETAAGERDTFKQTAETEGAFANNLVIENGLTAALTEHNVAPEFMPAAVALLQGQVQVKPGEGGKRQAFAGDKPLSEFVKEWAAGDAGKHYVKAPANGGGGAGGGAQGGGSGTKKISEMSEVERNTHYNAVGKEAFDAQVLAEKAAKP